jgi:hypothetical protein
MKNMWMQFLENLRTIIDKSLQEQKTSQYKIKRIDNRQVIHTEVTKITEEEIAQARERVFRKTPGLMKHHVQPPTASEGDSNA